MYSQTDQSDVPVRPPTFPPITFHIISNMKCLHLGPYADIFCFYTSKQMLAHGLSRMLHMEPGSISLQFGTYPPKFDRSVGFTAHFIEL